MAISTGSILVLDNDVLFLICQTLSAFSVAELPSGQDSTTSLYPLKAFSTTCKRLREIAAPELFRKVRFGSKDSKRYDVSAALDSIGQCWFTRLYTCDFTVNWNIEYHLINRTNPQLGVEFAKKLARVLHSLQNLETLQFEFDDGPTMQWACPGSGPHLCKENFERAFEDLNILLPSVRGLYVASTYAWLLPLCGNLETLVSVVASSRSEEFEQRIEAASHLADLRHLQLQTLWGIRLLQAVLKSCPELQTLEMEARGQYKTKFPDLVPVLAQFKELRTLVVADATDIGVGGPPRRGRRYYWGTDGQQKRDADERQREDVNRAVAQSTFTSCAKVEEVWIGNRTRATAVRGNDGSVLGVILSNGRRRGLLGSTARAMSNA